MSTQDSEHESMIKTPQQLIVVVVLGFAVPVRLFIMLAQFILSARNPDEGVQSAEAVTMRIKPVASVAISEAGAAGSGARSGDDVVKTSGAANAPKIGDSGAWGPRIKGGLDALMKASIKGKGAMPPRGGAPDLSDLELARAIVAMANKSGASFKEPAAPKAAPATKK